MPTVKRRTPANIVVQHDDGMVESVPLSRQNRLLFDHDLWGLLKEGDEIVKVGSDPQVTIIPNQEATEYTVEIDGAQPIHLGPDVKPRLIDNLLEVYECDDNDYVAPLIDLRDEMMDNRVRMIVARYLAEMPPFSRYIEEGELEVTDNGWLFHDELLVTWNCEFRHPHTTSRSLSGSVISPDAGDSAYNVEFDDNYESRHSLEIDGKAYRMTKNEMDFLTRVMWAAEVPT